MAAVGLLVASSLTLVAVSASPAEFTMVTQDSVRYLRLTSDAEGVWAANANGNIVQVTDPEGVPVLSEYRGGPLTRDGDGAFYLATSRLLRKITPTSDEPISGQGTPKVHESVGFGPDGRLLAIPLGWQTSVMSIGPDRTAYAVAPVSQLANVPRVGPDGDIYSLSHQMVLRTSVATGQNFLVVNATLAANSRGLSGIAFGNDGNLYVTELLANLGGRILRLNPTTGVQSTLLSLPTAISEPAFFGDSLYVITANPAGSGVGRLDVGTSGFQGFHPSFPLAPSPDLAITRTWVEREPAIVGDVNNDINEVRTVFVEITNVGGGDVVIDFDVEARTYSALPVTEAPIGTATGLAATSARLSPTHTLGVPGLAAGESVVVEFPWDMTLRAGDMRMLISVDVRGVVPELVEEANNRATVDANARVAEPALT